MNSLSSSLTMRNRGSRGIPQEAAVDRALGAAASLGVSLAILRFVVFMYKASKRLDDYEEVHRASTTTTIITRSGDTSLYYRIRTLIRRMVLGAPPSSSMSTGSLDDSASQGYDSVDNGEEAMRRVYVDRSSGNGLYEYLRWVLRRLFLFDSEHQTITTLYNESDGTIITHQGSCHCESVQFEVLAPRCLTAKDATGKIQYQHTKVPADSFRVVKGKEFLNTYYVVMKAPARRGAHAFCTRCGVHVLYAPSKESPTVEINVGCLSAGIRKLRVANSNDNCLSEGVAFGGQWDDQLSTISEGHPHVVDVSSRLFHSPTEIFRHDSLSTYASSEDKLNYKRYERKDDDTPSTPSTIVTSSDSYLSSIRVQSMDQDSSIIETASTTTFGSCSQGLETASLPISFDKNNSNVRMARHEASNNAAGSPQIQNQMRYYMRKHLSAPLPAASNESVSVAKEEKCPN